MKRFISALLPLLAVSLLVFTGCDGGGSSGSGSSGGGGSDGDDTVTEDTALSSLTYIPPNATLDPSFDKDTTSYELIVPDGVTAAGVTAQAESSSASIAYTLDGVSIDEVTAQTGLEPSDTAQELDIIVTNGDGSTTYTVAFGTQDAIENFVPDDQDTDNDDDNDTTDPLFTSGPIMSDTSTTDPGGFTISATLSESGTLYYVAVTTGSQPTASQIKDGLNSDGSAAEYRGSKAFSANAADTVSVTGLAAGTYTVYVAAFDAANNSSTVQDAGTISVNTAGGPRIVFSEIHPDKGSSHDIIEFYVANGGTLNGITVYRGSASDHLGTSGYTFPDVTVATGDYIVLYTNETGTDTATEFYAREDTLDGITVGTGGEVLSVYNSFGTAIDVIAFSTNPSSVTGVCLDRLDEVNTDASGDDSLWLTSGSSAAGSDLIDISAQDTMATTWAIYADDPAEENDEGADWNVGDDYNTLGSVNVAPATHIVLNEIHPDKTSSEDIIEFYVETGGTLDGITVYRGSASDHLGSGYTFPNVSVTAGSYIVLHVNEDGTDTATEFYAGTASMGGITVGGNGEVISVYDAVGESMDMVVFATDTDLTGTCRGRIDDVNTDGGGAGSMWSGDAIDLSEYTYTGSTWAIHRDSDSSDTNTADDWTVTDDYDTLGDQN
ncbi:MAG: cadherin-like beta sandwich domain-containing protein [Spirochaetota bacterium]